MEGGTDEDAVAFSCMKSGALPFGESACVTDGTETGTGVTVMGTDLAGPLLLLLLRESVATGPR